ncbi:MAG: NAD(P)H-hydrate epimerase, partial [Eggerthellaceae bacterium]|nr:NAD(P)H-hydrate epimerase [Eggerthellaceae bacterium]
YCTGAKAHEYYRRLGCAEKTGIAAVKLPSTSPANAACGLEALVDAYSQIFEHVHPFEPPTLDVARVVELEHQIASDGTSLAELMDRAGTALARHIELMIDKAAVDGYARTREATPKDNPLAPHPAVAFLCGSGNNGGDGWVAAEILAKQRIPVVVVTGKDPNDIKAQPAHDAAMRSMEALQILGCRIVVEGEPMPVNPNNTLETTPVVMVSPSLRELNRALSRVWVIADAILGTGFDAQAVKEPYHSWIAAANEIRTAAKLAVDVPSGVSAQRGYSAMDTRARFIADETITMIARKPGLSARECGEVSVAPLAYIEPYLEK